MSEMGDRKYVTIVGILRLWALDYSQQAKVFPESGMLWCEYMSAADNLIRFIPTPIEEGRLPPPAIANALRAYCFVIELPDVEDEELPEHYFNRPGFDRVRKLSREALRAMGEELKIPDVRTF